MSVLDVKNDSIPVGSSALGESFSKNEVTYQARSWSYFKSEKSTPLLKKISYVVLNFFIWLGNVTGLNKVFSSKVKLVNPSVGKSEQLLDNNLSEKKIKDLQIVAFDKNQKPAVKVSKKVSFEEDEGVDCEDDASISQAFEVLKGIGNKPQTQDIIVASAAPIKEEQDEVSCSADPKLDQVLMGAQNLEVEQSVTEEKLKREIEELQAEKERLAKIAEEFKQVGFDPERLNLSDKDLLLVRTLGAVVGSVTSLGMGPLLARLPFYSKLIGTLDSVVPKQGYFRTLFGVAGFYPGVRSLFQLASDLSRKTLLPGPVINIYNYYNIANSDAPVAGSLVQTIKSIALPFFAKVTNFGAKEMLLSTIPTKTEADKAHLRKVYDESFRYSNDLTTKGVGALMIGSKLYFSGYLLPALGVLGLYKGYEFLTRNTSLKSKNQAVQALEPARA